MAGGITASGIRKLALECGYAACGITDASPFEEHRRAVEGMIRRAPELRGLYEGLLDRADPRRGAPWVRSVIACVRWYGKYALPPEPIGLIGRSYLVDRRFVGCPDHGDGTRFRRALEELGVRVRRGGVPDRWAAMRAGVAQFGRNCFAYTAEHGSWINIETWRTEAELPADTPAQGVPCPEGCRACLDACPTGALCEPFVVRMDKCVAHLTYHAPEPIDAELWQRMGKWVYGCDACQDACPLNAGKWKDSEPAPWVDSVRGLLTAEALERMDETTYRETIHPRFPYISPENLDRWRRNAARSVAHARAERRAVER